VGANFIPLYASKKIRKFLNEEYKKRAPTSNKKEHTTFSAANINTIFETPNIILLKCVINVEFNAP
jgi:hypothetical protein